MKDKYSVYFSDKDLEKERFQKFLDYCETHTEEEVETLLENFEKQVRELYGMGE